MYKGYLHPAVSSSVISLDIVGRGAATPTSDSEEDLMRYPRTRDLWGYHFSLSLSDHFQVVEEAECVDYYRPARLISNNISMFLHLVRKNRKYHIFTILILSWQKIKNKYFELDRHFSRSLVLISLKVIKQKIF